VKGKGANLPDFDSNLPITNLPLVVQLRNNSTGICWAGSFATPKKNQPISSARSSPDRRAT
jgi:hypothetical protein